MKLLMNGPNPLNVLDIREVETMPIHFQKINVKISSWHGERTVNEIRNWIYNNLDGRFAVTEMLHLIDNKLENVYQIGFEKGSELSYFSLACSVLADDQVIIV